MAIRLGLDLSITGLSTGSVPFYSGYVFAQDYASDRYRSGDTVTSTETAVPGYSYTRSGTGTASTTTGSIESFAANILRRTSRGVLIEEARTNLALVSGGTTYGVGSATTTGTIVAATTYTLSRYFRRLDTDWVQLRVQETAASANRVTVWLNVATGALGTTMVGGTGFSFVGSPTVTADGLGGYRLQFSFQSATATAVSLIGLSVTGNGLATGAGSVDTHSVQCELGTFATSPIPTTGTAATRAADALAYTGLSVSDDFTIHGVVELPAALPSAGQFQRLFEIHDNSDANKIILRRDDAGILHGVTVVSSAVSGFASIAKSGARTLKFAITKSGNTFTLYCDGASIAGASAVGMPTLLRIDIGSSRAGTQHVNGYVKITAIDDRAFTSAEAIAVTS